MKEQQIQKQVIDYLRMSGWFVWKNNNAATYKQNTGKYIPAQTKGISDLTAIKNGFVIFIEIKTATGKLSNAQKEFSINIEKNNGNYWICRNITDAIRLNYNIDECINNEKEQ